MKHLKIIGLCLVAMFAMGMIAAAAASAAPVWEECAEGGSTTKYTESQCIMASASGAWSWQEAKTTEKVVGPGTLVLRDNKFPVVGVVEVSCWTKNEGSVGPGAQDRIEAYKELKCTPGKGCEKVESVEPRNLPWKTELAEVEKKVRDKITNGKKGTEAPGWSVTCTELGVKDSDTCNSEEASTAVSNVLWGIFTSYHLALTQYDTNSAVCTGSKEKTGEVVGNVGLERSNERGIRVS